MRATLALFALIVGCGSTGNVVAGSSRTANWQQRMSSGFVGCRPGDISITDYASSDFVHSWIASCGERELVCSFATTGAMACAPVVDDAPAVATPAPAP